MVFSDLWFLSFLPLGVVSVWLAPKAWRRYALLLVCGIFHAHYAGPAGMMPIIVLAIAVYFAMTSNRLLQFGAIALCVGALVHYKYTGLLNRWTGQSWAVAAAPLAISFFVFEFVHLISDRQRGLLKKAIAPIDFSVFAIFFPSLAAGPIKRFEQFQPELARLGRPEAAIVGQALVRILLGYFKKVCLGDSLAAELPQVGQLGHWHSSIAALALMQGIRIFVDFSGYSDMAIGFAGLLNIRLPENFSFPYLARNISEFWNRWHISLSSWIRDYIYIMMGGNRVSTARRFANLLFAMVLCGLWHGAAENFIVWGMIHGLALVGCVVWKKRPLFAMPTAVAWALTFAFVQLSWLVFFYRIDELLYMFKTKALL